jgi:NodT family efflux transporter outer membrane factor (OMF) lipoprotein
VAQAATVLKNALAQAPDIAVQRIKYQNALAVLTGSTASLFQLPERPLLMTPVVVPAGLPSELLERRPDIAAAERRMAAANANIGVATAAFFPTVKLSGIAGFQSGGLDMLFDWPSNFWAVGPSLTVPLFQGGQLNATLAQTQAVYEETVARYRQTVLTAFAEVENNLSAEQLLADEYQKVQDALQSVRRQLEIADNRYRAGLATYLEVAAAQNAALGIERTGVRLRGLQRVSVAALIKSLGGGWQAPEI